MSSGLGFGKDKGKSSSTSNSVGTQTPNVPDWIKSPYMEYGGLLQDFADNSAPTAIGPSSLQNSAYKMAGALTGNPILNNTSKYMNPFIDQVINNSARDLNTGRQRQIAQDQAAATAAGAFGGSRHGVVDSLTNDAYFRDLGDMTSQLRYQGYTNAQQAALNDAQQTNQNIGLLGTLGEQQRGITQENTPYNLMLKRLQNISGLLGGLNGDLFTGQTRTGSEVGTGKNSSTSVGASLNWK